MNSKPNIDDQYWMAQALECARQAELQGEVPIGAVLIKDSQLIASAWNQTITATDPSAHAEVVVLRQAAKAIGNYRLLDTTLYVTLEPCAMCAGALIQARIDRLVFGAFDPRAGAVQTVFQILDEKQLNHQVAWQGGVLQQECSKQLKAFFASKR